jgi:putative glycosyltransferase
MYLSVVATMYHSAPYLREFYARIKASAAALNIPTESYEVVFVNDGSPDDSLAVALTLRQEMGNVRIIDLSRNHGHHRAMMIGVGHATGDMVFLIDCDLEEPPESLTILHQALQNHNLDVAFGVQQQRKGNAFNRFSGGGFWRLFNWITDVPVPPDPLTARLMTRRYAQQLIRHQERVFNIEGLWALTGFNQMAILIEKTHAKGTSTYTLAKKIDYALNALIVFSLKPLRWLGLLGAAVLAFSVLQMLGLAFTSATHHVEPISWLIGSVWLVGGLILFALGIIAQYIGVIMVEAKSRPTEITRAIYEPIQPQQK